MYTSACSKSTRPPVVCPGREDLDSAAMTHRRLPTEGFEGQEYRQSLEARDHQCRPVVFLVDPGEVGLINLQTEPGRQALLNRPVPVRCRFPAPDSCATVTGLRFDKWSSQSRFQLNCARVVACLFHLCCQESEDELDESPELCGLTPGDGESESDTADPGRVSRIQVLRPRTLLGRGPPQSSSSVRGRNHPHH